MDEIEKNAYQHVGRLLDRISNAHITGTREEVVQTRTVEDEGKAVRWLVATLSCNLNARRAMRVAIQDFIDEDDKEQFNLE